MINISIENNEVPNLREAVGWDRRDQDYPKLFERCNFWAGIRDSNGILIAFGYIVGMGLQHGYMEDIIVHPDFQQEGIGKQLVKKLLEEAADRGLEIVTLTFELKNLEFYQKCGFSSCPGGIWRKT
ncbi:GNAT family N-acetyltransferase [Bacillus cereus]|nr:GNAT family N-acetyltransferase [Bacillus cereus]PGU68135.1 GNAT family N-acetyltransferase [Bacillus cereus]